MIGLKATPPPPVMFDLSSKSSMLNGDPLIFPLVLDRNLQNLRVVRNVIQLNATR